MIDVVQKKFADFSGAPYDDERVRIAIDEGRNYIASRDRLYDIIKISVTDTWTASALGAYALTENYRYTVQAIMDFVSHLEPGGYLSIIRWTHKSPCDWWR
jgi:spermidine synthase